MNSVIVSDFGVTLAKTGDRLVVRGPKPKLELIDGGPQLFLPLGLNNRRPTLSVVASGGEKRPAEPLRDRLRDDGVRPPKASPDRVEMPLFRVGHLVIASMGVSVSTDLIEACCERGIRISFLTRAGKPFAMISSPMLTATVLTRREQLMAYGDARGVELAKTIVRGKLGNQAALLRYFGKYLKTANPDAFAALLAIVAALLAARNAAAKVAAPNIDAARQALLSIEGNAGNQYWRGFRLLMPPGVEFDSREHRGAPDPINSALNYGYGILYSEVWGAIMNAGLEPFAGFLHVDRPGKPSLVLDLIEEFRQPAVDRAIVAALGKGSRIETRGGMLTDDSRRLIAAAVLERLESEAMFRGKRHKLKSIIQIQARNVASFVRGDGSYRCYSFKW
jgi:CRISPR-associated protein Cas1